MSRFHYTWQYRPGRINVADPLSRNPSLAGIFLGAITRSKSAKAVPVQKQYQPQAVHKKYNNPPVKSKGNRKRWTKA